MSNICRRCGAPTPKRPDGTFERYCRPECRILHREENGPTLRPFEPIKKPKWKRDDD